MIQFFINNTNVDMSAFENLEEFKKAFPNIDNAGIWGNIYWLDGNYEEIWRCYEEWDKYEEIGQSVIKNYYDLMYLEYYDTNFFEDALDAFFGIYNSNYNAGKQYYELYMKTDNIHIKDFLKDHVDYICMYFLESYNGYYYHIN